MPDPNDLLTVLAQKLPPDAAKEVVAAAVAQLPPQVAKEIVTAVANGLPSHTAQELIALLFSTLLPHVKDDIVSNSGPVRTASIANIVEGLRPYLAQSDIARQFARELAQAVLDETTRAHGAPTKAAPPAALEEQPGHAQPSPAGSTSTPAPTPPAASLRLKLGDESVQVRVPGSQEEFERIETAGTASSDERVARGSTDTAEISLEIVRQRCELKAAACRYFIEERSTIEAGGKIPGQVFEMIEKARSMPKCFLWVLWREQTQPDNETLELIARCYETLGEAVDLVQCLDGSSFAGDGGSEEEAFALVAEADSALRVALQQTWLTSDDVDQAEVHHWLRQQTSIRKVYLPRYMKLDDPADPAEIESVHQRITVMMDRLRQQDQRGKRTEQLFKKVEYHARRVSENGVNPDEHDVEKISAAINELVTGGIPESHPRFREVINGAADRLIAVPETSPTVNRVLEHVQRWQQRQAEEPEAPADETTGWSDQVQAVRRQLAGGTVVIIGGEPRPEAAERIKDAFELEDVVWPRLVAHGSADPARVAIVRPEVRLVLVLVKLVGHVQADGATAAAKAANKPIVNLKAGYNPEQVANAVLEQASQQLEAW